MKKPTNLKPITSEEELFKHLILEYKRDGKGERVGLELVKLEFNYPVTFHFKDENLFDFDNKVGEDQKKLIRLTNHHYPLIIKNCVFKQGFRPLIKVECNIEIINCWFDGLFNLKNHRFKGKLKVRQSHFRYVNFFNTTFEDLADFYKCHFYKRVIFMKTDFLHTTVFSASTFYQNVLFTYSLLDASVIFRGTHFRKGLDLSTSIGEGSINSFGIILGDYDTFETNAKTHSENETVYDRYITKSGVITTRNKRETFRILKQNLVSQGNISESLQYKLLEKEALRKELKAYPTYTAKKSAWDKLQREFNLFNLWANRWSNNHGTSYGLTVLTFLLAIIPFYFSMVSADDFTACFRCKWALDAGFGHFFQFLNPAHKANYLGEVTEYIFAFHLSDFMGRLIVGFGIYQFIQAFRKYR